MAPTRTLNNILTKKHNKTFQAMCRKWYKMNDVKFKTKMRQR